MNEVNNVTEVNESIIFNYLSYALVDNEYTYFSKSSHTMYVIQSALDNLRTLCHYTDKDVVGVLEVYYTNRTNYIKKFIHANDLNNDYYFDTNLRMISYFRDTLKEHNVII